MYDRRVRNKKQITYKKIYTRIKYKITNLIARLELSYIRIKSGLIQVSNLHTYYYTCNCQFIDIFVIYYTNIFSVYILLYIHDIHYMHFIH